MYMYMCACNIYVYSYVFYFGELDSFGGVQIFVIPPILLNL